MVDNIPNRTPSDLSARSESSELTTVKFTRSHSQAKLETLESSSHSSLNDWKPLKPTRTTSFSEESSFFSEDISTTYNSEDDEVITLAASDKDCASTLISEITDPSMESSRFKRKRRPKDSLSLIYGDDAVKYLSAEGEADIKQEASSRPLHDSFGSMNDLPPVPVRRNVSLDMDSMDKFFNGSVSDFESLLPPKPPRREQSASSKEVEQTRDSSPPVSDTSSKSTSSRSIQPRHASITNSPVLGSTSSVGHRVLFHRRSSLSNGNDSSPKEEEQQETKSEEPSESDKPTVNTPAPTQPSKPPVEPQRPTRSRRSSLSNVPIVARTRSKLTRRFSLPRMPGKGSFSVKDGKMPKVASREDKPAGETMALYPHLERRSSLALSTSGSSQEPNSLMKRARAFVDLCSVSTHTHHFKMYNCSFVGSEAVDLMIKHGLAKTREDAVFLGHRFCKEFNLFHHVTFDHTFKDGQFIYRFSDGVKEELSILPYTPLEELRSLGAKFSTSMEVSSHTSRMKTYKNSFLGNRAVDHMLANGIASTREHAVFLGQRMMEELNLFHHVSDQRQFKDSPHLYRFVAEQERSSFDNKESLASVMSTIRKQIRARRISGGPERLAGMRVTLAGSDRNSIGSKSSNMSSLTGSDRNSISSHKSVSLAGSERLSIHSRSTHPPSLKPFPTTPTAQKKSLHVTFGDIQVRQYERCLEYNPSTSKGPSLGLGWNFYDDEPVAVDDRYLIARSRYGHRLSSNCREYILMEEWGYSKSEIRKATKKNEKIRRNRKKSFNKVTVVRSYVSEKIGLA